VILRQLPAGEVSRRLKRDRLCLQTGPFVTAIQTPINELANAIETLYADFPVIDDCQFADFHIRVAASTFWRRRVRPYGVLTVGGFLKQIRFRQPLATAFFEWGFNGCIFRRVNHYLVLHGAVVERNGKALALLGISGSGKSTLCAALTTVGWRLLSDEIVLVRPGSPEVLPLARPISLKNASIRVIRELAQQTTFGPAMMTTRKGLITHMRPPTESVERMHEPAELSRFLLVHYESGASTTLSPVPPARALIDVARHSFNYGTLGREAFEHVAQLVDQCPTDTLTYGDVREAVGMLEGPDYSNAY
jgi:HprK-related kinase A